VYSNDLFMVMLGIHMLRPTQLPILNGTRNTSSLPSVDYRLGLHADGGNGMSACTAYCALIPLAHVSKLHISESCLLASMQLAL